MEIKVDVLNQEAMQAINQRNFQLAIQKYTIAIQLMPGNAILFWNRAGVLFEVGMREQAAHDALRATVLEPEWAQVNLTDSLWGNSLLPFFFFF